LSLQSDTVRYDIFFSLRQSYFPQALKC